MWAPFCEDYVLNMSDEEFKLECKESNEENKSEWKESDKKNNSNIV